MPVELDKKVASPHPFFRTKSIVHAVVDERGVRFYFGLAIQGKIE